MNGDHNMYCSANQQKPICKNDLQVEIGKREWVGLTDEEVDTAMDVSPPNLGGEFYYDDVQKIARAIEAKLKEKNHVTDRVGG